MSSKLGWVSDQPEEVGQPSPLGGQKGLKTEQNYRALI